MRRAAAWIAIAGLLPAACALTPDYQRPELDLPPAWLQTAEEGASISNLPWWEIYHDPVLQGLIETALEHNQDLAVALARMIESSHLLHFTMADQLPFLDAFGSAGRGRLSRFVVPGASTGNNFAVGATLSFEVDLWRKFSRATEGARGDLLTSEAAHRNVTIGLVANVASSYFLLRDLDARLEISQRTVVGRRGSLEIIAARFEKGTVPELDVNQAEVQLAIAEAAVASFERQVVQAENALRVLIGSYPGPIERGAPLDARAPALAVPAGLPSELLDRRPDVVAAEQTLAAETARIGVAEAFRYPAISLTGSVGAVANELTDFNTHEAKAWNIAADVFQPLFNAGQLRAQARAQHARAEAALHIYIATVQQAFREVEDALIAVRTLREEHAARSRQVVAARNAMRLSRARYDAGVVDFLEVLDTERSLFSSELDESATRQAALSALVQLYKALGGGWTPSEEPDEEQES